jgi:hypothetical protein
MWKEVNVAQLKVLSKHLPGGSEENNDKSQSDKPFSKPVFDPGTF